LRLGLSLLRLGLSLLRLGLSLLRLGLSLLRLGLSLLRLCLLVRWLGLPLLRQLLEEYPEEANRLHQQGKSPLNLL
jgi:hypothetical protein